MTVQGSNTNPVTFNIEAIIKPALILTSSQTPQIINVGGDSLLFSVQNTGGASIENVRVIPPPEWIGSVFFSSCPNSLGPQQICNFTMQANASYLASGFLIQGDNADPINSPIIAFRYGGGLVFSREEAPGQIRIKVVAEADYSATPIRWGVNGSEVGNISPDSESNCDGKNDGSCNTTRIVNCISNSTGCAGTAPTPLERNAYAAGQCSLYAGGGFDDWYLPAICEWLNPSSQPWAGQCVVNNIVANLKNQGYGNLLNNDVNYLSSTETTFNPSSEIYSVYFINQIALFNQQNKNSPNYVRCVRAFNFPL